MVSWALWFSNWACIRTQGEFATPHVPRLYPEFPIEEVWLELDTLLYNELPHTVGAIGPNDPGVPVGKWLLQVTLSQLPTFPRVPRKSLLKMLVPSLSRGKPDFLYSQWKLSSSCLHRPWPLGIGASTNYLLVAPESPEGTYWKCCCLLKVWLSGQGHLPVLQKIHIWFLTPTQQLTTTCV